MTKFPFYPPDKQARLERYAGEFEFDHSDPTPWMPLRRELRLAKIALVTTSGIRTSKTPPFPIDRDRGCSEVRALDLHAVQHDYTFDYTQFDDLEARKDLNVLVPIAPVITMAERRLVGEVHEELFSFVGHCEDPHTLRATAAGVADRLHAADADAALIFTASHLCNLTGGLIARELEKHAISTILLASIKEIAQEVRIPRSVFINFPFGMLLGRAFATPLHESIVGDMLSALKTLDKPGRVLDLPYKWDAL